MVIKIDKHKFESLRFKFFASSIDPAYDSILIECIIADSIDNTVYSRIVTDSIGYDVERTITNSLNKEQLAYLEELQSWLDPLAKISRYL